MSDEKSRRLCVESGFDPGDPSVWSWWQGLSGKERDRMARWMDRGKMALYSDLGVEDGQIESNKARRPR